MSLTYIVIAEPGKLGAVNMNYTSFAGKLAGLKLIEGDEQREYEVNNLSPTHNEHFQAKIISVNSANYHSDMLVVIVDLGYVSVEEFVLEVEADICSTRWGWVRDYLSDVAEECQLDDFTTGGFVGGPMFFIFPDGAQHLRKRMGYKLTGVQ